MVLLLSCISVKSCVSFFDKSSLTLVSNDIYSHNLSDYEEMAEGSLYIYMCVCVCVLGGGGGGGTHVQRGPHCVTYFAEEGVFS